MASAGVPFDINPLVPQGSETLKLGDDRIRNLATGILRSLGFPGDADVSADKGPFGVDPVTGLTEVVGDPITPLGIATAQFAGRRALFASVTSPDSATYGGTTDPAPTNPYDQNAVYIIQQNDGGPNSGASTLQLNGGGIAPLVRANGSALAGGNFQGSGTIYLVTWDTANFRIMDFIGGTVPLPVVLPGDPTDALQAAPKQYVDGIVEHPASVPLGAIITITPTEANDILTTTITTPNDGNSYLLRVDYGMMMTLTGANEVAAVLWVEANGVTFALSGATYTTAGVDVVPTGASGVCVTVYGANVDVVVKVRGRTRGGNCFVKPNDTAFPEAPPSFMTTQLMRTSA